MFRFTNGRTVNEPIKQGDGLEPQGGNAAPQASKNRRVRVDVQRNLDALLQAAKTVFASSGVDAPVREIAEKAGVGVGTVYRHFPQRADLVAAVCRREIDACADAAPILAAVHAPFEALAQWMQRYASLPPSAGSRRHCIREIRRSTPCPPISSSDCAPR